MGRSLFSSISKTRLTVSRLPGRSYMPKDLHMPRKDEVDSWFKRKASDLSTLVPKAVRKKLPWLPHPTSRTSLWDRFKMLLDDHRYFWWTQQWLAGNIAWGMFVGLEGESTATLCA